MVQPGVKMFTGANKKRKGLGKFGIDCVLNEGEKLIIYSVKIGPKYWRQVRRKLK